MCALLRSRCNNVPLRFLNSKIISFHLQMRRRSKPDQIEERRSVSSVWAGKSTHGSGTTRCRRVEMRLDCLFLLVQQCLFGDIGHILTFTWPLAAWRWATLESILHYHTHTVTITELLLMLRRLKLKSGEFRSNLRFHSLHCTLTDGFIQLSLIYTQLNTGLNQWICMFQSIKYKH